MLVPGTKWKEYHKEVGEIMTSELIKLKLIDNVDVKNQNPEKPAYKNISCMELLIIWDLTLMIMVF